MTTSDAFWEAAASGSLVMPRCGACGAKFFPPSPNCPTCRDAAWSWESTPGAGVVRSHTLCERPHIAGIEAPYVLAIVELDDGWTLLTNIVGDGRLQVRSGDRVSVVFEPRPVGSAERIAPVFAIDANNSGAHS